MTSARPEAAMTRRTALHGAGAALTCGLAGCASRPQGRSAAAAYGAPRFILPFRVGYGGRPVVSVFVNGQGPFDFVFDTGASQTAVFRNLARRSGVEQAIGPERRVFSFAGFAVQPTTRIDLVMLGPDRFADVPALLFDDWDNQDATPQGVLGLDIIARYAFALDVAAGEIRFYDAAAAPAFSGLGWESASVFWENFGVSSQPLPVVSGVLDTAKFSALLDTGLETSVGNRALVDSFARGSLKLRFGRATRLADANDEVAQLFSIRYANMRIGGVRYGSGRLLAARDRIFEELDVARRPFAFLGFDKLGRRTFAIDFSRNRFYAAPVDWGADAA